MTAIGTGDISLHEGSGNESFFKYYLNELRNEVGVFQIPHHGSYKNWNEEILKYTRASLFFASYGVHNNYSHLYCKTD